VNVNALRRNALALTERTGLPLIPMIKADAYGVGAAGVVRSLEPLEPMAYGVASVEEGEILRHLGIARPIIVFTPILEADYPRADSADLTPSLGDAASIRAWSAYAKPYQLAIDTGMNRAGLPWRDVASAREAVRLSPPAGAFTHFHSAELENGSAELQVERFFQAIDALGVDIPFLHADNSAAAARGLDGRGRWGAVRPGLFLYGVGAATGIQPEPVVSLRARVFLYGVGAATGIQPEPVVSLRARVVDIRWVEAGDTVSYDAVYTAPQRERIATATIGYGDGYPRSLSDKATALVNGARVRQRGLVTMDMTMFDVTSVPCEIGDVVTLWGEKGGPELTVQGVARSAGMSPYELLTGLAPRLQRRFNEV